MNSLLLIGIAVFLGIICGKIFSKFKIPQVVGYIVVGLIIGKSFFHLFNDNNIQSLNLLVEFTLGLIGCIIGAELKMETFKKYGSSIYSILICEGVFAFLLVTFVVWFLTKKLYLGLLLGAIASATDPASTISVLWEYKAKGPLSRTVTSIVALDDGLALIIYGLVNVLSQSMITHSTFSLMSAVLKPMFGIIICLSMGSIFGFICVYVSKVIKDESVLFSFIIGMIALVVGIALHFNLDLILSSMAMGMTIANMLPKISEKIFGQIRRSTESLYILFFVVIGAQLDTSVFLMSSIIIIVFAYLVARSTGKIFGAMFGATLAKDSKIIRNLTGICLFTQGGVAIGLSLSISHNLSHFGPEAQQAGVLIINIVAATTFVVQLIGPSLVKLGIVKAKEINKDVTKEDIIESLKVDDVVSKEFVPINEGMFLGSIIKLIKEKDIFNFPVINKEQRLRGLISVQELKEAMLSEELADIVTASDIAVESPFVLSKGQKLKEVCNIFNMRDMDFLPLVENKQSMKVIGIVENKNIKDVVNLKLLKNSI